MPARLQFLLLALLCGSLATIAKSQTPARSWLPPQVEQAAAEQLAERMVLLGGLIGSGEPDLERIQAASRTLIGSMAELIEGWGVDRVVKRAPELAGLGLGVASNPYLDALARYHVCNMVLMLQLDNPAYQDDTDRRIASTFGLSAVTIVSIYLRQPFIESGGNNAAIEAHLTGPSFTQVFQAVQAGGQALEQAETECQPVVVALLEKPLALMTQESAP